MHITTLYSSYKCNTSSKWTHTSSTAKCSLNDLPSLVQFSIVCGNTLVPFYFYNILGIERTWDFTPFLTDINRGRLLVSKCGQGFRAGNLLTFKMFSFIKWSPPFPQHLIVNLKIFIASHIRRISIFFNTFFLNEDSFFFGFEMTFEAFPFDFPKSWQSFKT